MRLTAAGLGGQRMETPEMMPSVPSAPMKSCFRSYLQDYIPGMHHCGVATPHATPACPWCGSLSVIWLGYQTIELGRLLRELLFGCVAKDSPVHLCTMRFEGASKVLAKHMLKYYRTSQCFGPMLAGSRGMTIKEQTKSWRPERWSEHSKCSCTCKASQIAHFQSTCGSRGLCLSK